MSWAIPSFWPWDSRWSPAVPVDDAPTVPIPVIPADLDAAVAWLEDLHDRQRALSRALNRSIPVDPLDRQLLGDLSVPEQTLATWVPGMPLDGVTAQRLALAGVGQGCPQAAPSSTLSASQAQPVQRDVPELQHDSTAI